MAAPDDFHQSALAEPLDARSIHLRELVVETLAGGERGHIGSTLSLIEILRVLYDDVLNFRPDDPTWPDRDRLILSKGHGCIALYCLLADKGFIDRAELPGFCHVGSRLGGHPEWKKVPGVEASTGALGHGLPIGIGLALAQRMKGRAARVLVICGDGEINEGSVWEGAMAAAKHGLDNLVLLVDYNKIQSAGAVDDICPLEPLGAKFESFGFAAREVNGHSFADLQSVFAEVPFASGRPNAVICHTVKGKGFDFAEDNPFWHHKSALKADEIADMRASLEKLSEGAANA